MSRSYRGYYKRVGVWTLKSERDWDPLIAHFWNLWKSQPTLIFLEGPLGVGKTSFARALLRHWNANEELVCSPTYSLHQRYEIAVHPVDVNSVDPNSADVNSSDVNPSAINPFIVEHFDLYRIKSKDELELFGFWDLLNCPPPLTANYILIEWPELVDPNEIPAYYSMFKVHIQFQVQSHVQSQSDVESQTERIVDVSSFIRT